MGETAELFIVTEGTEGRDKALASSSVGPKCHRRRSTLGKEMRRYPGDIITA